MVQRKKISYFSYSRTHPAEHFAMDSVTLHTIQLIQHARKVKSMINNVPHIIEMAVRTILEPYTINQNSQPRQYFED